MLPRLVPGMGVAAGGADGGSGDGPLSLLGAGPTVAEDGMSGGGGGCCQERMRGCLRWLPAFGAAAGEAEEAARP